MSEAGAEFKIHEPCGKTVELKGTAKAAAIFTEAPIFATSNWGSRLNIRPHHERRLSQVPADFTPSMDDWETKPLWRRCG
jgi:hypothetical protein